MKKTVLIAFVLTIALLCSTSALAQETAGSEVDALRSYVEAMTSKDWDSFLELSVKQDRPECEALIKGGDNSTGLFNVTKMAIRTVVSFDLGDKNVYAFLQAHTPLDTVAGSYDELSVVFFTADVEVLENMRPNFAGFDGRVAVLAKEDGKWRVAAFACADRALMEKAVPEAEQDEAFLRHIDRLKLRNDTGLWAGDDGVIYDCTSVFKGLEGFKSMKPGEYRDGQFSDVNEAAWYGVAVKGACLLKIMSGMGDGSFAPSDTLTVAQAVKMASVVHDVSTGGDGVFTQGEPWYRVYVNYAKENGIIDDSFTDFNRPATRAEMAHIFSNALPETALPAINTVDKITDVADGHLYASEIFELYRAGVLTGYEDGSFHPDAQITRAEAAVLINRMANVVGRVFVYQSK